MLCRVVCLQKEAQSGKIVFDFDGLCRRETVCVELQEDFSAIHGNQNALAQAILWNNLKTISCFAPVAAKTKSTKDRIVGEDRDRRAQRAAVTEINLAGEIP